MSPTGLPTATTRRWWLLTLSDLERTGFDVRTLNHAKAVLTNDFPGPLAELCGILAAFRIADVELIRGGGGQAKLTQRLVSSLKEWDWVEREIVITKTVDGSQRSSISHKIDHVRGTSRGSIGLEIEWNNKDPFFDRDLENFQRLHREGAISVGIVITRGRSLQEDLLHLVTRCAHNHGVRNFNDLGELFDYQPTGRQRDHILKTAAHMSFLNAWARQFVQDKFGSATTHWSKLQQRIKRGVGNPCPLLLVGLPAAIVDVVVKD